MHFIGLTIHTLGGVLIGITAIRVHSVVSKEMKLDKHAYQAMRKEQYVGILGIALMIAGYLLQIIGR